MKNYIFEVGVKNDIEVRTYNIIKESDMRYIKYNKFLEKKHFTNIEENDDYIPMITKNEALMVLRVDQFEPIDIEFLFDLLRESLYTSEEEEYEESANY